MEQIREVPVADLHPHEQNPRVDAAQVDDLVASIREHGIEVPLVAAPAAGGDGFVVLAGHRRLTAAHELGLATVPVQVREDLSDAGEQLAFIATENLHRDQLTPMEESRLIQDMLDLGWSQAKVVKATALRKPYVAERVKLGRLGEETGQKVHRGQISIEDALVIATYASDPDTVAELEDSVGTGAFNWAVSRAKQRQDQREKEKAQRRELEAAGARIVDNSPSVESLALLARHDRLPDAPGTTTEEWVAALASAHETCPGHAFIIQVGSAVPVCDRADELHPASSTGEPAAEAGAAVEADPWDELSREDFAAAAVHRARHLGEALPMVTLEKEAKAAVVSALAKSIWTGYPGQDEAAAFVETLTGATGKAAVIRKLKTLPLGALVYLQVNSWDILTHQRYMAEGKRGGSYWGPKGAMRKLLELTGYNPTEVEERACELATGHGWWDDGTDTEPASAAAEGGEQA